MYPDPISLHQNREDGVAACHVHTDRCVTGSPDRESSPDPDLSAWHAKVAIAQLSSALPVHIWDARAGYLALRPGLSHRVEDQLPYQQPAAAALPATTNAQ